MSGVCAVWDYFLPAYNCPLKEKIGIDPILGDNGKWLCGVRTLLQRPGCVIYSFGCAALTTLPLMGTDLSPCSKWNAGAVNPL